MNFYNETWFWTGVFSLLGALIPFTGMIIKEIISRKTKLKIERIKIFDGNKFDAHIHLYQFINNILSDYTYDEYSSQSFDISLKTNKFDVIIKNTPYYNNEIRKDLIYIYSFHKNLSQPDRIDEIARELFFSKELLTIINKLKTNVESILDNWGNN